ncbi:unnamed protein product [Alopecurus aequalis]
MGTVVPLVGRQLITLYLSPNASRGKLSNAKIPGGCSVTAGVDVFAVSPNELPFEASHIRPYGDVWGYFSAAHMAESVQPAPGGCWAQRAEEEKAYVLKGQTFGYRRRFAFHVTRVEADGTVMWAPTRWMMKEYRLNKDGPWGQSKKLQHPEANLDFVIRKFFTKKVLPRAPPAHAGVRLPSSTTKLPVKATKTKTRTKPKKVVPPPYARSEGGEALQQGGTTLPPRSARPPLPPKVVTKPVASPSPAQVIAKPVDPSNQAQVIAKPVAPLPQPQAIPTPVATPPALPSQDAAALSRAQPHNPNANMEIVVYRPPAKPLTLASPLPPQPGLNAAAGRMLKIPSGSWIIGQYLRPKAVGDRQIAKGGLVAEGVDVFAVSPGALPSPPMHRTQNGQVRGYFFAARPTPMVRPAHGGCWMPYGRMKRYCTTNGEVIALHRRFQFHTARLDGHGTVVFEPSRWVIKEYSMNKAAPSAPKVKAPGANMDLVVLKVFTKPAVPPPPPEAEPILIED